MTRPNPRLYVLRARIDERTTTTITATTDADDAAHLLRTARATWKTSAPTWIQERY